MLGFDIGIGGIGSMDGIGGIGGFCVTNDSNLSLAIVSSLFALFSTDENL